MTAEKGMDCDHLGNRWTNVEPACGRVVCDTWTVEVGNGPVPERKRAVAMRLVALGALTFTLVSLRRAPVRSRCAGKPNRSTRHCGDLDFPDSCALPCSCLRCQ